jgi:hypothetical protein
VQKVAMSDAEEADRVWKEAVAKARAMCLLLGLQVPAEFLRLALQLELAAHGTLDKAFALEGNQGSFLYRVRVQDALHSASLKISDEEALLEYTRGVELITPGSILGAFDRLQHVALLCGRSACLLALYRAGEAVADARAALALDETSEAAWLRLGQALELSRRGEALEAYRRIRSNAVAAQRIPVLEAPPIEVTAEGLSGVPEGSLHLYADDPFWEPLMFLERARLPSEPLMAGEARLSTFDNAMRDFMRALGEAEQRRIERMLMGEGDEDSEVEWRHVFEQEGDPQNRLWFDVVGTFVSLYNVVDDGCSRKVSFNSTRIPVILVAVWTGKGEPPNDKTTVKFRFPWKDLERVRAMLLRHATLLSDSTRQSNPVPPGFVLSVLSHVAVPELDYSIHEGCCIAGCVVECAPYRCSRCLLARYCGKEHMATNWKEHKKLCVPHAQRQPTLTFDCSRCYLDRKKKANFHGFDRVTLPRKTFPGVVVVKIRMIGRTLEICDPHAVLIVCDADDPDRNREAFEELNRLMRERTTVVVADQEEEAYGYFDADMTQKGRLVLFMDRNWKCTW